MMKKLNTKGITLAELIVSFALVSVSTIYFYQTIYTVRKIYKESDNRTNFLVEESYNYRITNLIVNKNNGKNCEYIINEIKKYSQKDDFFKARVYDCNINDKISYIKFKIDDEDETYYFYRK